MPFEEFYSQKNMGGMARYSRETGRYLAKVQTFKGAKDVQVRIQVPGLKGLEAREAI